ncbi:MAG: sulfotransferase [Gammaproteobacteria bacterium]|nr:sulfotransferase [Gammaproteobacteria bacterium]
MKKDHTDMKRLTRSQPDIGKNRTPMRKVDYILAGYERGGTTLLSEVFRANGFESGFECGVLLGQRPADFPEIAPYWDMLLPGWRIDKAVRRKAIKGDFEHFYDTLCSAAFPDFTGPFFDKTPKYMESLGTVLHRAPSLKGAVVIHRDPRAVFVSQAKRLSPDLSVSSAVEKNFDNLVRRYLSYFIGSIAHLTDPRVLFVPFEDFVTREESWLKFIGLFAGGASFTKRKTRARYINVSSQKMDHSKTNEFDRILPIELQKKILHSTQLASLFFAGPMERTEYGDLWQEVSSNAEALLSRFELPAYGHKVDGEYFEPLTYLIRYPDVLKAKVNPVEHYRRHGRSERRKPA